MRRKEVSGVELVQPSIRIILLAFIVQGTVAASKHSAAERQHLHTERKLADSTYSHSLIIGNSELQPTALRNSASLESVYPFCAYNANLRLAAQLQSQMTYSRLNL
eukprot:146114-Pelagomonas_calceolata.AAC.2